MEVEQGLEKALVSLGFLPLLWNQTKGDDMVAFSLDSRRESTASQGIRPNGPGHDRCPKENPRPPFQRVLGRRPTALFAVF
jgi:hypothetical protein